MSGSTINKIIIVAVFLIIIILIPLILAYILNITVKAKQSKKIKIMAEKKAIDTNKPLIIFSRTNGIIITYSNNGTKIKKEKFIGNIQQIAENMEKNSCVIIISETLEYIDGFFDQKIRESALSKTITLLRQISGDDLYIINIDKKSPRILWDYKIKQIMCASFYLPGEKISWIYPKKIIVDIQNFYYYIFKILPYNFFTKNPIIEQNADIVYTQ